VIGKRSRSLLAPPRLVTWSSAPCTQFDAGQTINRILGMFETEEQEQIRARLADNLRWVISQRLVSKIGGGRYALLEIMGSNLRTQESIRLGGSGRQKLL